MHNTEQTRQKQHATLKISNKTSRISSNYTFEKFIHVPRKTRKAVEPAPDHSPFVLSDDPIELRE